MTRRGEGNTTQGIGRLDSGVHNHQKKTESRIPGKTKITLIEHTVKISLISHSTDDLALNILCKHEMVTQAACLNIDFTVGFCK